MLVTQRLSKQTFEAYASNLAGSIVGIFGIMGIIMNFVEERFESFMQKRDRKTKLITLARNHRKILKGNFNTGNSNNLRRDSTRYLTKTRSNSICLAHSGRDSELSFDLPTGGRKFDLVTVSV